jgi:hypothetical protein
VDIKFHKETTKPKSKKPIPPKNPEEIAKLQKAMTPLALKGLKQIEEKYADKFGAGYYGPIVKVALVVARRTFVLAKFETLDKSDKAEGLPGGEPSKPRGIGRRSKPRGLLSK